MTRIIENPSEQDIRDLTIHDRVVMKHREAPREYEVGLWRDEEGTLLTDSEKTVRYANGEPCMPERIVRIIKADPVFEWGTVIGDPDNAEFRLVFIPWNTDDGQPWAGIIGYGETDAGWYTHDKALDVLNNHGWVVIPKPEGGAE